MTLSCIVSKLAQFSSHMIGPILGRWCRNPQYLFPGLCMIYSVASVRLKYIPYSNKIRIVFASSDKNEDLFNELLMDSYLNEYRILDPRSPEVERVMRVLVKIVQGLSDGLRLRHECRVSAANHVDVGGKNNEQIIVPRHRKDERPEHSIEHLDGLNWVVTVVESDKHSASYHGKGRIVIHTEALYSSRTEEELATILAHEVGHGVAMHLEGCLSKTIAPLALIPWTSAFWGPIYIRLWDMVLYCCRRMELEAFYIGLMLMASAGYDPRLVPELYKKYEYMDRYYLDTLHPCWGRIIEMMSQDTVMNKAVEIYEQVRTGQGVPSFIEKGKKVLCRKEFNPFSVILPSR